MLKKLLYFVCLFTTTNYTASFAQLNASERYVPGQLMIQTKAGFNIQSLLNSFDSSFELKIEQELSQPLAIWLVSFNPNQVNEIELRNKINSDVNVKAVQFNHYIEERVLEPNDPSYVNGTMWDMNNTGQNGGTNDADIDAPEAWEISTGGLTADGDTIVVAVVDGGFFLDHEDISFWKNYAEIPGNGIDDDGNGYIDDVNGWNANSNNGTITSDNHGTHVSGTVAAKGNNNVGVVGVNWNTQIMAIKGSTGVESVAVIAYGYAFKMRQLYNQTQGALGAFVVSTNSSFGVNNGSPANFPIWCAMYDSLGSVGVLSAGATMNNNSNVDVTGDIPTSCPQSHLITVTNTDRNDVKNTGAAYGLTTIDLGAPGTTINSTLPNNTYGNLTGTSMATPHVAGAVALMISAACPTLLQAYKENPDSMALVFKDFMLNHVDPNTSLQNKTVSGGRLNIYNSLAAITDFCTITSDNLKVVGGFQSFNLQLFPNPASSTIELFYQLPQSASVSIQIIDVTGRMVKQISKQGFGAGYHNHLINVDDLESGVYMLNIVNGNQASGFKKFIKS